MLTWFQAIQSNASMVAQTPVPLPNSARAIYVYKRAFVVFCNLIPHLGNRVAYSHRHLGRLAYRGYAARTGKKKEFIEFNSGRIFPSLYNVVYRLTHSVVK